jgi:hypothetical protein
VSGQDDVASKQRLDDWLDDALADTFPASDPVASPPSEAAAAASNPPTQNHQPPSDPTPHSSRR